MKIETRGNVAILRLESGRANAMGPTFVASLSDLVDEAARGHAGAVVITGYERFFSAGLDLPTLIGLDRPAMERFLDIFERVMLRVFALERPVVAAVNGHAIAGGCVLALQADYRYMVDHGAKMGLSEVQLGIGLPAVVIETLRCQVLPGALRSIALEGRLFEPPGALEVGLVDGLARDDELLPRSLAKAEELAALPPGAFAQVKRSLRGAVVERVERLRQEERRMWLDTWFSQQGQARLRAAIARLRPAS